MEHVSSYSPTIYSGISALRSDNTHADVTLQVGSKQYPAHKLILTAVSPVFQRMFSDNWREKDKKSVSLQESSECEEVFGTFLDFLYRCNNGVKPLSEDNVVPLLTLADKYEVVDLKDLCSKYMETLIEGSIEKAFGWLSFAEDAQLGSVIRRCYDVICWNFAKATLHSGWMALTSDQLLTILKGNDIIVDNEYDVFCAALKWLTVNNDLSESCENEIVPLIEFRNMQKGELQEACKSLLATEYLSVFNDSIDNAIGFRNAESYHSQLPVAVHRRYKGLNNMATVSAKHVNSATLSCSWPRSVNDIQMECQLSYSYNSAKKMLVYTICVFKTTNARRNGEKAKSCRISGRIILTKVSNPRRKGIVHHVLTCNTVTKEIDTLNDGDKIVEFPGIPCVDIGQFDGHYLGQFSILYNIAIEPHAMK